MFFFIPKWTEEVKINVDTIKLRIDMKFPKTEQEYLLKPFILYGDTEHLTYKMKVRIKSEIKYQDHEIEYRQK